MSLAENPLFSEMLRDPVVADHLSAESDLAAV